MESSTHKSQSEEQRQAQLRRQIALLQAQLKESADGPIVNIPTTPKKRKSEGHTVLAAASPSPKKKKVAKEKAAQHASGSKSYGASMPRNRPLKPLPIASANFVKDRDATDPTEPVTSTVLAKLASFKSSPADQSQPARNRTSAFTEKAIVKPPTEDGRNPVRREDDLTVVEDLELGPYEHTAPFDDPHFEKLEPHSGIRLSSRTIPYDDFQDYFRGRYYLSPSKLYSVVRLQPNKSGYDVPVEGDWVTIAVVAERGPVKYSKAPVAVGKDEKAQPSDEEDDVKDLNLDAPPKTLHPYQSANKWKGKAKANEEPQKPSGKKYMNMKLVDFGCRARSSASGGTALIRGDAFLTLLLFEADRVDILERDDGVKEKIYKGGSRGAFEKLSKLKEGSVVAFLNPRILKPFQRSGAGPLPNDNVLAITPDSADAIAVIGQSQDLGMCTVLRRDGKVCGSWCDKRVSDVCDYHIQHAVQRKRAGRAEFSSGTSGMTSAATKPKSEYDPARQRGLKPEPGAAGGATYILSGHIVNDGPNSGSLYVSERLGRDAQAKAARQISAKDADRALERLLKRDKEGTRTVKAARDFARKMERKAKGEEAERNARHGAKGTDHQVELDSDSESESETDQPSRNAYSASLVKALGFDPSAKDRRRVRNADVENKLQILARSRAGRKEIELGPRPGKLKSAVHAPDSAQSAAAAEREDAAKSALSRDDVPGSNKADSDTALAMPESDEEPGGMWLSARRDIGQMGAGNIVRPPLTIPGGGGPTAAGMVDLDSSDVEL